MHTSHSHNTCSRNILTITIISHNITTSIHPVRDQLSSQWVLPLPLSLPLSLALHPILLMLRVLFLPPTEMVIISIIITNNRNSNRN